MSKFESLANFRDVGESVNGSQSRTVLQPGLLYRSARPDETTKSDRRRLTEDYRIKTIMDLRTSTEHINAAKKHSELFALAQSAVVPVPESTLVEPIKIPGVDYAEINLNGKAFERSLIWQLSYFSLAKMIGLMVLGYRMEAIGIIGREVLQPRGLIGLGTDTLDYSGKEIKEVFDVLADETTWPMMIHCTQGKDRTGIIVMLILLLCGVDIDAITADYIRSETDLESEMETRRKETASIGLDESFAKCPREFPQRMVEHIEERHGSIQNYLRELGIGDDQQTKVRSILLADSEREVV